MFTKTVENPDFLNAFNVLKLRRNGFWQENVLNFSEKHNSEIFRELKCQKWESILCEVLHKITLKIDCLAAFLFLENRIKNSEENFQSKSPILGLKNWN